MLINGNLDGDRHRALLQNETIPASTVDLVDISKTFFKQDEAPLRSKVRQFSLGSGSEDEEPYWLSACPIIALIVTIHNRLPNFQGTKMEYFSIYDKFY
ncbi:hypothetical protein J6590_026534 [Homalodisca vitripennis]|nr:hypothetical protein J6590_026534 [Homalodisca vitripennis]